MRKLRVLFLCLAVVILVFVGAFNLFARAGDSCSGVTCGSQAYQFCANACSQISSQCSGVYLSSGYCLGFYSNICMSHWAAYCDNGDAFNFECVAYDPACY